MVDICGRGGGGGGGGGGRVDPAAANLDGANAADLVCGCGRAERNRGEKQYTFKLNIFLDVGLLTFFD